MRTFLVVVFFAGLIMVVLNEMIKKPKTVIEYRYLPRDLDVLMREDRYASASPVDFDGTASAASAEPVEPAEPVASAAPTSFFSRGIITRQQQ